MMDTEPELELLSITPNSIQNNNHENKKSTNSDRKKSSVFNFIDLFTKTGLQQLKSDHIALENKIIEAETKDKNKKLTWWIFTFLSRILTEKRILLFFLMHFIATMTVWGHFFYIKYNVQEGKVPEGANRYWWKRLIPPLEFGAMHAILFQMGLLPLTMARFTTTTLAKSFVNRLFIPLNRITAMHIHLGYTMCSIVFLATIVFFLFFGLMCEEQKQGIEPRGPDNTLSWCDKFTSEIMCTGYGILGSLLLIAITSYLRDVIHYEYFYIVHHLVFAMFGIAIAHTLDAPHRDGLKDRSQTFKWFVFSLWWYFLDRLYCASSHLWIQEDLKSKSIISDPITPNDGFEIQGRCVYLKVRRPIDFIATPGQWAYISIPAIDSTWHPFSIASDPAARDVAFMIDVKENNNNDSSSTWTAKLYDLIHDAKTKNDKFTTSSPVKKNDVSNNYNDYFEHHDADDLFTVKLQGPFGSGLSTGTEGNTLCYAGGSGIVPILSMLQRNSRTLIQLDKKEFTKMRQSHNIEAAKLAAQFHKRRTIKQLIMGFFIYLHNILLPRNDNSNSITTTITSSPPGSPTSPTIRRDVVDTGLMARHSAATTIANWYSYHALRRWWSNGSNPSKAPVTYTHLINSLKQLRMSTFSQVLFTFTPVFGCLVLSLTISWQTHTENNLVLRGGMKDFLAYGTFISLLGFGVLLLNQSFSDLLTFVNFSMLCFGVISSVLWHQANAWGELSTLEYAAYLSAGFYMLFVYWSSVMADKAQPLVDAVTQVSATIPAQDNFHVYWTSRDLVQIAVLLPTLNEAMANVINSYDKSDNLRVARTKSHQSITIYVTHKSDGSNNNEEDEVSRKKFHSYIDNLRKNYPHVNIVIGRMNVFDTMQAHFARMIKQDSKYGPRASVTNIAFCGSTYLGSVIDHTKETLQWLLEIKKADHHRMHLVQENYGHGSSGGKKKEKNKN